MNAKTARRVGVSLLAVAVLFGLVSLTGELGPALKTVGAADIEVVAAAALCQAVRYLLVGALVRRLAAGGRLTRGTALRVGLITVGLGSVLPAAPLEGLILGARELERHGVGRRRTLTALGLTQWYGTRGLFAVAAPATVTLGVLAATHARVARSSVLLAAAVILVAAFVAMGLIASRPRVHDSVRRIVKHLPGSTARNERIATSFARWCAEVRATVGARRERARLLALSVAATTADAACFAVAFRAAHVDVAPKLIVAAYAVAMIASLVPLLPGGIGVAEAAVVAFLHATHAPVAVAAILAGMLVYRALGTMLPAVAGVGALAELRIRRLGRRSAAAGPAAPATQAADA